MRRHLTYANTMATIAVFIALGGSSYALSISGKNIKNASVTGVDVKNNSITGKQVKESSLVGSVPKSIQATKADLAKKAETAAKADTATLATNAINAANATTATNATNATSLGGLSAANYLRSGVILRGGGNLEATSPETILVLPALTGAKLTTDGDLDTDRALRLDNTSPLAAAVTFVTQTGPTFVPAGSDLTQVLPAVGIYSVSSPLAPGTGYTVFCSFQETSPKRVYCQAIPFEGSGLGG